MGKNPIGILMLTHVCLEVRTMANYLKNAIAERLVTPQSEPIPGREAEMVENSGWRLYLPD
jgi:hypothetical protein